MHRLYSLKFEADPESEIDNNGYWRTTNSGWQIELEECQELINVEWIIYFSDIDYQSPMGWVETEYDNFNSIDDSYNYSSGVEKMTCLDGVKARDLSRILAGPYCAHVV